MSIDRGVDQEDVVHIHNSAIRRKEIMAFAATCKDPEMIMLSDVSQTMRDQHQMLSLTYGMLKNGDNGLLCRTVTDSQKKLWFPNETSLGVGGCTDGLE